MNAGIKFNYEDVWVFFVILQKHDVGGSSINDILSSVDSMNRMLLSYDELKIAIEKLYVTSFIEIKDFKYYASDYFLNKYCSTKSLSGSIEKGFDKLERIIINTEHDILRDDLPFELKIDEYKMAVKEYAKDIEGLKKQ